MFASMDRCQISVEAVRIQDAQTIMFINTLRSSADRWQISMGGRGQDRTHARHDASHRIGSRGNHRLDMRANRVSLRTRTQEVVQVVIPMALEGFNPFEGVDASVFEMLAAEAAQ
jgi:hypothetical protein